MQHTGRDPFNARGRAWEYTSGSRDPDSGPTDMATCMSSAALRALDTTLPPITTLNLPVVQLDKLEVLDTLGPKLVNLTHLTLTLSLGGSHTPRLLTLNPKNSVTDKLSPKPSAFKPKHIST